MRRIHGGTALSRWYMRGRSTIENSSTTRAPPLAEKFDGGPEDGRLARAGAAGDDQDLPLEALPDGPPLERREDHPELLLRVGDSFAEIEVRRPAGKPRPLVGGT